MAITTEPTTTTKPTTSTTTILESGAGGSFGVRVDVATMTLVREGAPACDLAGVEWIYEFTSEGALALTFTSVEPIAGFVAQSDENGQWMKASELDRDKAGMPSFTCTIPDKEACFELWFARVGSSGTNGSLVDNEPDQIFPPTEANPKFKLRPRRTTPLSGPGVPPTSKPTR